MIDDEIWLAINWDEQRAGKNLILLIPKSNLRPDWRKTN